MRNELFVYEFFSGNRVGITGFVPHFSLFSLNGDRTAEDLNVLTVDDITVKVTQWITDPAGGIECIGNVPAEYDGETVLLS